MKQYMYMTLMLTVFIVTTGCTERSKKAVPASKPVTQSIADLKNLHKAATTPAEQFYAESKIVNAYASLPLDEDSVKEAKYYATDLLLAAKHYTQNWNYGNVIHHSNLVLGRVSLFEGKLEDAKKYLLLAAKTSGSPQLNSFGPNMTLAKELLERKEQKIVLKYIDACMKFWSPEGEHRSYPDLWKREIAAGKIPDFGSYLKY